jgi:hypothetical protein
MLFNQENYKAIREACRIEFKVPLAITAFSSSSAPPE